MQPRHRVEPQNSTKYSRWHSGDLGGGPSYACYATDIDFIEVTYKADPDVPVPVAVIEEKQMGHPLTRLQGQIYPMLSKLLRVPFYIVRHDLETEPERRRWLFEVTKHDTGEVVTFNEERYADWLYELRERARG